MSNKTEDDIMVTEDDNREVCLPSSISLYLNQRDYNATKQSIRIFRDNCNDESDFNPADIRDTLFALLHDKGK